MGFAAGDWVIWRELELKTDWRDTWGDRQRGREREEGGQIVRVEGGQALVRIGVTEDRWVALGCLRKTAEPANLPAGTGGRESEL
jgi:hypothetical protein